MDDKHHDWARADECTLARYVQPRSLPQALTWSATGTNRLDTFSSGGILAVAETLYDLVRAQPIEYDRAPLNPRSHATQLIRKTQTVLDAKQGTCLDLAVLYAAMCLDNELLPILVCLEGHALAGFSRRRTARKDEAPLKAGAWEAGRLKDLAVLREVLDTEFVLVECTGAARTKATLSDTFPEGRGRESDGEMTFARACEAGREQLLKHAGKAGDIPAANQREFLYALDIRDLQTKYGFDPVEETTKDQSGTRIIKDFDQSGQVVHGPQTNIAGNVHGPVLSGEFLAPVQIGNIRVGRVEGPAAIGAGARVNVRTEAAGALEPVIQRLLDKVNALPSPAARQDAQQAVQELKAEAVKGEQADEGRVKRWFSFLAETAPDVWEVAVETFKNPIAGVARVFQLVADRAREDYKKRDTP